MESFFPKAKSFQSILVRMPNWIGDLVMATPILHDLRIRYPNSEITAMCQAPLGELLIHDPNINEVFSFTRASGPNRRQHKRNIIETIKTGRYDLGVLLPNSLSSAWWFWQAGIPNRLGYSADFRAKLLTHPVSFNKDKNKQHLVKTYKEVLSPLGMSCSNTSPNLYLTKEEKERAYEILEQYSISKDHVLIGVNPGAAFGSAKCWLPERFEELALKLVDCSPNVRVVFFGDMSTSSLVKDICRALPSTVVNLAGLTTLRELMALISVCQGFVTNDSGPMHIADALQTPLVALFGSTNEVTTGPYKGETVIHKHVDCSPCYKRTCPIDFRCMKGIETGEVFDEVQKIIKKESLLASKS